MTENEKKLTDKEIDYYHGHIVIKSIFSPEKNIFEWMVCCKKCGGAMFPHTKDMEKDIVDKHLKEHKCLEISGLNKTDGG